jgi:hypothetical protein
LKLLPLACFVAHGEVQTQHIMDTSVKMGPLEPLWHFRVRTTPQGGGVSQVRTGPILNFDVHKRATLIGGYYYTRAKEERSWSTTHRAFTGVEVSAWDRKIEIDVRSMVERHFVISGRDYGLFRNRVRISPPGSTAPYIGAEVFVDADGLRSMRYSTGIRRTITEDLLVDIGYFYENRRSGDPDRHMLGTTIHWRDKSTRLDGDP